MGSYSDDLRSAGYSRNNISAGGIGEQKVMNLLATLERPGLAAIRGVSFSYGGGRKRADIDILIVAGRRLYLIDAKHWKSGKYARHYCFGSPRLYRDGEKSIVYPDKGWPANSALGPQGRRLLGMLEANDIRPKQVHKRTVMTNPKSTFGLGMRSTTADTKWMTWTEFERYAKKIRPGNIADTEKIIQIASQRT